MKLFMSAIIPVILLCMYIYKKDTNKEPRKMLIKIFIFGILSCIPILIVELLVAGIFTVDEKSSFIWILISTFFGVAIIEEFFKWGVTRIFGYNSKNFDEIFDIIVYSVFASLGFACIENILYVLSEGFTVAVIRALISVPGHMCDGVLMGYFMSKAKVNSLNNNQKLYKKNMLLSLLIPTIEHTLFDAFLIAGSFYVIIFLAFHIATVIVCFIIVKKTSKMQQNINYYIKDNQLDINNIRSNMNNQNNVIVHNNIQSNVINQNSNSVENKESNLEINYCPICGRHVKGYKYCPNCGLKLKDSI